MLSKLEFTNQVFDFQTSPRRADCAPSPGRVASWVRCHPDEPSRGRHWPCVAVRPASLPRSSRTDRKDENNEGMRPAVFCRCWVRPLPTADYLYLHLTGGRTRSAVTSKKAIGCFKVVSVMPKILQNCYILCQKSAMKKAITAKNFRNRLNIR